MSAWRIAAYRSARPLLFRIDPERIHHLTLSGLRVAGSSRTGRAVCRFASGAPPSDAAPAPIELMGMRLRNPIGLAAGFDKDGLALRGWAALGFGFVELGTVTPRPQAGNPRPRLFRLVEDEALVNRMGFNNRGADALARRIRAARPHLPDGFVVGVNIGRNRDGDASDFPAAARAVADVADYVAVNVSSPNTPGLRDLQEPARLRELLDIVHGAAPQLRTLVKLSPDLEPAQRDAVIHALLASPAAGVILSNTTLERHGLHAPLASEPGGLSGRPLLTDTLASIAGVRAQAGDRLAIIASGGIGSGGEASRCIAAGADLVQLWTGLVHAGPALIGEAIRTAASVP